MSLTTRQRTASGHSQTLFCDRARVRRVFEGKRVAIVGSGPGVLDNAPSFIDSHEVVVRVNNYKLSPETGGRTDVYYSYFGDAIRKTADELKRDGVYLCMAKCPDAQFMESDWHAVRGKMRGVDFRYIYRNRADWWFCDTYVPTLDEFRAQFDLLGGHVPTTGFSAILDVLSYDPRSVYLTGFDFFASGVHNVNERWRPGDPSDPIRHRPDLELQWLAQNVASHPISVDRRLAALL